MLTILHGDNTVASRNQLVTLIQAAKQKGIRDIVRLDGKKITTTDLIQATQSASLFGNDRLVVIEQLFARPKSVQKDDLLSYLVDVQTDPHLADIIIWEEKLLTKTQTKKFISAKIQEFKTTKLMFKFLESIRPDAAKQNLELLTKTKQNEDPEFIFVMLIRQIRLLLQVKGQGSLKMAPWQLARLRSQANLFNLSDLIKLHQKLLDLDHALKTSHNSLSLSSALDILIATI